MRGVSALPIALVTLVLAAPAAWGHAEMESSTPGAGSTVRKIPPTISVALTEPPAPGTTVHVIDGCSGSVATGIRRAGHRLEVDVTEAEPGRWNVVFQAISGIDGHSWDGDFGFRVRGKTNCRGPTADRDPVVLVGGESPPAANGVPIEDSGLPVVPLAIGSVVVVALAWLLRRAMV
jgi:methionine-rich copper-binding protein CopC